MKQEVLPDPEALARRAAEWIAGLARNSRDRFALCLSGGSTPKRAYEILAGLPVPWDRVHLFWGDERFVPPDDPRSNQAMVRHALLDHVAIPPGNLHPMPTVGLTADQAAQAYQDSLAAYYGAGSLDPARPLFDVVLLGLGTNGHTASLFPDTPVLAERTAWAAAVQPEGEEQRLTLTYPALESARAVAFLVAGADKRPMLARLRAGDESIPAGKVHPSGTLVAMVDSAAAG